MIEKGEYRARCVGWRDRQRRTSGGLAGGLLDDDDEHVDGDDEYMNDITYLGTSHIDLLEVVEDIRSVYDEDWR